MSDDQISKLSNEMRDGFKSVNKRLDAVDSRFDVVDARFDAVDSRFDSVDKRFDAVDARFNGVDKRLDAVDSRFDVVDARFASNDKRTDTIDSQLENLTKLVITGFHNNEKAHETMARTEDIQKMHSTIDDLSKRQEISDDERLVMSFQLNRLHDWVERAAKRIDLEFAK